MSCDNQVARRVLLGTCWILVFRVCSCIYLFVRLRDFYFQWRKFTIPRGKTFYLIYVWICFTKTRTDTMSWLHHRSYGWRQWGAIGVLTLGRSIGHVYPFAWFLSRDIDSFFYNYIVLVATWPAMQDKRNKWTHEIKTQLTHILKLFQF